MLLDFHAEQLQAAVEDCARELLAEAGIEGSPVDAFHLARSLGLTIAQDGQSEVRARFIRLSSHRGAGRGTILLAEEQRAERKQWAVAHEVGEFAALRVFTMLGVSLTEILPAAREQMANQLAGALLLPADWFGADGIALNWDLLELKQLYSTVSHELISRRMLQMRPPVIVSLFDEGKLIWRRSNVLRRPPPVTAAEKSTWQWAHVRGQASRWELADLPEGLTDIRCWPVHEAEWRREIMRTGLEDW